jgi:uncharacterized protein
MSFFDAHIFHKTRAIMKKFSGIILMSIALFIGCKKKQVDEPEFDRQELLKNYAENLIVPAYKDARNSLNILITELEAFSTNLTVQQLESAQSAWVNAYNEWQYASIYNIGPAAEQGLSRTLVEEIATFPVSSLKIEDIIATSTYNFGDFNRDARGFLAIEYLLFYGIDNQAIVTNFQNQSFRSTYLIDCANHIKTKIDAVISQWDGAYKNEFITNNGTDVGSSASQLYNAFVKSFETNKNFKIELPMGLRPGQTQAEPQLVEAFYSGKSLLFITTHLTAIEKIYYGKSKTGSDGIGFKEYLESVEGGPALVSATLAQWANVISSLNTIPTSHALSQLITDNPQPIDNFRVELQKHTRYFKSDMSSLLGIAITFSSGDGD